MRESTQKVFSEIFHFNYICVNYIFHLCCDLGRASEEEEEIGGSVGGGEGRPAGDGHSSGHGPHLQHSQGSSALYPGEWRADAHSFSLQNHSHQVPICTACPLVFDGMNC